MTDLEGSPILNRYQRFRATWHKVRIYGRPFSLWHCFGQILTRFDYPEQALACFKRALRFRPGHAGAQLRIADILSDLKMPQLAVPYYFGAIYSHPFILQSHPKSVDRLFETIEAFPQLIDTNLFQNQLYDTNLKLANLLLKRKSIKLALYFYRGVFYCDRALRFSCTQELEKFLLLLLSSGLYWEARALVLSLKYKGDPSQISYFDTFVRFLIKEGWADEAEIIVNMAHPSESKRQERLIKFVGLVDVHDWLTQRGEKVDVLRSNVTYTFRTPRILGSKQTPQRKTLRVPDCELYHFKNVELVPSCSVISSDKLVVYEPAADPRLDALIAGSWQHLQGSPKVFDKAYINTEISYHKTIPQGFLLAGRSQSNYFHWMIEYLPRIWAIFQRENLKGLPIVINAEMPFQHYQALTAVFGDQKIPVCFVNDETVLRVNELVVPSLLTFLPDRFDLPYSETGALSIHHVSFLRSRILKHFLKSNTRGHRSEPYPKKIFVKRGQHAARGVTNEHIVEQYLITKGFTPVSPLFLPLDEQVQYFHHAEQIVITSGAALTNVLFCKPGAKIVALTSERNKDFCIYSNLASIVGADFWHLTGLPPQPRSAFATELDYAFASFEISIDKIERALKTIETSVHRGTKTDEYQCLQVD